MKSLDTETTGVDLHHGARPFLVTMAEEGSKDNTFWEWDVNPLTRVPIVPDGDLEEIQQHITGDFDLILQNAKFDFKVMKVAGLDLFSYWPRVKDTLIGGHLLASNQRHDLTSMTTIYVGRRIGHLEDNMKRCVNECRRVIQQARLRVKKEKGDELDAYFAQWNIAEEDLPGMPSAKTGKKKDEKGIESDSPWKFDCWLPRAMAKFLELPLDHEYWTVTSKYANGDSAAALWLWKRMEPLIRERGLWEIFLERMKVLPVAYKMEMNGVTVSKSRLRTLANQYRTESNKAKEGMLKIAAEMGYELKLPKGASPNNSLREFCFDHLQLEPIVGKKAKTQNPSLDKEAIDYYLSTLPEGNALNFIKTLVETRSRDTAVSYMESYERFWLPWVSAWRGAVDPKTGAGWYVLHPSLNPTGTDTLRWSSSNPNSQNISKKKLFNLRYGFGPAPGREWWSFDAKNIELRLPAYKAGEQIMINLFERPNDPPYFGSNHLLVSHILHPKEFEACRGKDGTIDGRIFKDEYESTLYQWIKNGNFAVQYGAVETSGTADRAYHVPGAQRRIQERFSNIKKLNDQTIAFANKYGYVETMPDKTVNPKRGYPLMCTRTEYGRILETVPFNYYIQGTAMQWMAKAMVRCGAYMDRLNGDRARDMYYITLQIHDELVFDFPRGTGPKPWLTNLPKAKKIKQLMELGGDDIGIPTPVSIEYHTESYSEGRSL